MEYLQQYFGKAGSYYYWAARGVDERPVLDGLTCGGPVCRVPAVL